MWVQSLGQEDPWRSAWQPIPVFLPGESHGQRSLEGYGLLGCQELGMTAVTEHARPYSNIYISISEIFICPSESYKLDFFESYYL